MYACAAATGGTATGEPGSPPGDGGAGGNDGFSGTGAGTTTTVEDDGGIQIDTDADSGDPPLEPDSACAAAAEEATATALPVDIIWMVDNSSSMATSVQQVRLGLNAFANLIAAKSLDYRVIMLSLRGKTQQGNLHPICIPQPLAGDDNCGNSPRFFHSNMNIYSTQPLEQFLGTLAQTNGYQLGQQRGGEPWASQLRPEATKTIVVVTDDNARLSATQFENFPGGQNPYNSLTLPPGILHPSWNGLFNDYVFSALYGWGSDNDPSERCHFPDASQPASSGPTYTTLVNSRHGVRAKICDGQAAWQPFFDAVAQAVIQTAQLSCNVTIPTPSSGTIDPTKVNVAFSDGDTQTVLNHVPNAAACGTGASWYYDDPVNPTQVILCPQACDDAQLSIGPGKTGKIEVLFGCATIIE
ncbi:hypothetical protein [Chondromyces apiculatus]|uniref:VWFA domain-containing protein n=1 Tax=Chondromyces apiculatus DSM 436 TaxID=1192034 RepID=A0A017TFA8_9BACT|nr:hypothetical protein [Chondromyces apiculatus]EYF07301.1 Hypothetical protein CAP_0780 [Chondromyces apiculatus DSM 436]